MSENTACNQNANRRVTSLGLGLTTPQKDSDSNTSDDVIKNQLAAGGQTSRLSIECRREVGLGKIY